MNFKNICHNEIYVVQWLRKIKKPCPKLDTQTSNLGILYNRNELCVK